MSTSKATKCFDQRQFAIRVYVKGSNLKGLSFEDQPLFTHSPSYSQLEMFHPEENPSCWMNFRWATCNNQNWNLIINHSVHEPFQCFHFPVQLKAAVGPPKGAEYDIKYKVSEY